jgi:hypothetical protein
LNRRRKNAATIESQFAVTFRQKAGCGPKAVKKVKAQERAVQIGSFA